MDSNQMTSAQDEMSGSIVLVGTITSIPAEKAGVNTLTLTFSSMFASHGK
jgi:hypothetical protein